MIWEIIQYYRTPVKYEFIKPMGYLKEGIAMIARANRCQATWQSHYANCQQSIHEAIGKAQHKVFGGLEHDSEQKPKLKKVIVLGAGSLNDIPLQALSQAFQEVLLVDLVFLPAARNKIKLYSNIQLIEHDVTESLSKVYHGKTRISEPNFWLNDSEVDLIISLNLITQLPLIPVRWLIKHQKIDDVQAQAIGHEIIQNHLNYLSQFSAVACLIADRENREMNIQTGEIEKIDPWWGVSYPPVKKSWDWNLIPKGEISQKFSQTNHVGVSYLNF